MGLYYSRFDKRGSTKPARDSQTKLGVKLVPAKAMVTAPVIDAVERLSEN